MSKKTVYAVDLISRSIQTKLVYASSPDEARKIVDGSDWMEKEEMLDSETEVREAVIQGKEKEGQYPDFYPSNYVWLDNGEVKRFSEI